MLADLCFAPMNACLYGTCRHPDHFAHLGISQTESVVEGHDDLVLRIQNAEQSIEISKLGIVPVPCWKLDLVQRYLVLPPSMAPVMLPEYIKAQFCQPATEAAGTLISIEFLPGAQEGFLGQIFCQGMLATQAPLQQQDSALVALHQFSKGSRVSQTDRLTDQCCIARGHRFPLISHAHAG